MYEVEPRYEHPPKAKRKFFLRVAFGRQDSEPKDRWFETLRELKAYVNGLEDAAGWTTFDIFVVRGGGRDVRIPGYSCNKRRES